MNFLVFCFETASGSRRGIYQVLKSLHNGMRQIDCRLVSVIFANPEFNLNQDNDFHNENNQHFNSEFIIKGKNKKLSRKIIGTIVRNTAILVDTLFPSFLDQPIALLISRSFLAHRVKEILQKDIYLMHWAFENCRIASCIAIRLMDLPVDIEKGKQTWLVAMSPTMISWKSRKKNYRLATFVHDLIPLDFSIYDESILNRLKNKNSRINFLRRLNHCCKNSDKIICVSHVTAKRLIQHNPSVKTKISVIHPSISEVQIHNARESSSKYMLPVRLCSIGSIEPRKNWPGILQALLNTHGLPPVQFIFVGGEGSSDQDFHKKLRSLANRLNTNSPHTIIFTGRISAEEKCKYLQQSAAFVYVPFMEGAALPIIEAQLIGCPTLISDLPVFREFIHADHAYFANPNQPASIGAALSRLCADLRNGKCRPPMPSHLLAPLASPKRFAKEVIAALAAADRR